MHRYKYLSGLLKDASEVIATKMLDMASALAFSCRVNSRGSSFVWGLGEERNIPSLTNGARNEMYRDWEGHLSQL